MKRLLLIIALLFITKNMQAQPPWTTTTDSMGMVSFDTPHTPAYYNQDSVQSLDSGNIIPSYALYNDSLNADSSDTTTIVIQVHISDSAIIDTTDEIINGILAEESGDILRTIAQLALLVTPNSTLVELEEVTGDVDGMDLGIKIERQPEDEENPAIEDYVFTRYFLHNGKFYSFVISGTADDIVAISAIKTQLYNSIVFH